MRLNLGTSWGMLLRSPFFFILDRLSDLHLSFKSLASFVAVIIPYYHRHSFVIIISVSSST